MRKLTCFKKYDIRGELNKDFDEKIAYRIGRAYAEFMQPTNVVIGGDPRLSSESLKMALAHGLMDAGTNVFDIGLSGSEEIYFATFHLGMDGGIEVTASHNPINYNGMKLVGANARPIGSDTGLRQIQRLAEENNFSPIELYRRGTLKSISILNQYIDHLMSYIDFANFKRVIKIVFNCGNGAAGHVIDEINQRFAIAQLPVIFINILHHADGSFPNGIPNPLLPECREITSNAVLEHQADMGIAFDGDFDRCFFFDSQGEFIEGYYIVGLLAEVFLQKNPGSKIIHDPRLTWNTIDIVNRYGGTSIMSKTGHAFIKQCMREEDAIYGGEMSAHHYFRDFAYCDSGMIPWLMVAELISLQNCSLREFVAKRQALYPVSGEINCKLNNAQAAIDRVCKHYESSALCLDRLDGISMEYMDWRFNLRSSNTEPLVRLNIESKNSPVLIKTKLTEVIQILMEGDENVTDNYSS